VEILNRRKINNLNVLILRCDCGEQFKKLADRVRVRCPRCRMRGRVSVIATEMWKRRMEGTCEQ